MEPTPDARIRQLESLELDVASVQAAVEGLDAVFADTQGRGGRPAADRIRALVAGDRFSAEFAIRPNSGIDPSE